MKLLVHQALDLINTILKFIDMICDNCGATIDANEEFCPNCGMQLIDVQPKPRKKKKYNKKSRSFDDAKAVDKPIKQRYIENSQPESYDYSHYFDDDEYEEYESPERDYHPKDQQMKSGIRIMDILLFILIALILGFITGLLMFGSQLIPPIPGVNS